MLAAASPALARGHALAPAIRFVAASHANYTVANRPPSAIRLVVIHVTESSAPSAITWFENPRAKASANYVVSSSGSITQMVPDSDIAWQAGNWAINRESIGVEHEGYTYRPGSFTDAEYRASARLVGFELRSHLLPIDRSHVIGHSEVPDPNHAGLFGGFAHHTDPGRYWDWTRYMRYVASYAHGDTPAPTFERPAAPQSAAPTITGKVAKSGKVSVSSSGLADGQTVSGYVRWQANVSTANVARVDFLVDGRVRWTEKQQPFRFGGDAGGWDTTGETNGVHVLTLRVVTTKGVTAGQSFRVNVVNSPFAIAAAGVANGQIVRGRVDWEAVPSGAAADHVDFLVDGKVVHTESAAPYVFNGDGSSWDTTSLANGPHTLGLRAIAVDGRVAESTVTVVVANAAQPAPKPQGQLTSIVMKGVGDGQQVSGLVHWEGVVNGPAPDRVEFWIDGRWRWTERSAPYVFNGDDGSWDTTKEQAGAHVLTVRALRRDGLILDAQTFTVIVQSRVAATATPVPTPMSVVSSIPDGATVHGGVAWTATVSGSTPDHVDFLIDGTVRHVEHSAPYEFGTWDTTKETNGPHALVVRAVAKDGTTTVATETVLVSNAPPPTTPDLAIASQSLTDGQTVSGALTWTVVTTGATPDRVEYWIDGTLRHTEQSAPYEFAWDTKADADGTHRLVVVAYAGTRVVRQALSVTVANAAAQPPAPSPPAALAVVSETLHDGQTVSGAVSWQAVTSGPAPSRVEFWIDGTLRWTEHESPYVFNGDGSTWDTTKETDGAHQLRVKAVSGDQVAVVTIGVTVANAPAAAPPPSAPPSAPPALAVTSQTLTDGQTLTGTVSWFATVTGDVRRVELLIDGSRVGSFRRGPYGGTLDTTQLRNGTYTFTARVVASDGSSVSASVQVTVSNP